MNIVKIENVKRITGTNKGLTITSNTIKEGRAGNMTVVVLSEDDMMNDNVVVRLRGYTIDSNNTDKI